MNATVEFDADDGFETTETEEEEVEEVIQETFECFRDGMECHECSNECCSGDLDDGSGWFKCPNGMEFCGDQDILGAVLC